MELFKHYHRLEPNPREKTFLETIGDVDVNEDNDGDMMDFIESQVSTAHTVSCLALPSYVEQS